jgi:hypothetical protein
VSDEREHHCEGCRDDWSFHMRRCPFDDCRGVVDDELVVPTCCACGRELPDGPDGPMARAAPAGHVLQSDVPESEGVEITGEAGERIAEAIRRRTEPH